MKNSLSAGIHPGIYTSYNHMDDGESSVTSNSKLSHTKSHTNDHVNYITFNQDGTSVAVGLQSGYKIFNCNPNLGQCYQSVKNEPIGLIEMLYTTSLVVIVGLGEELGSSPRKLKVMNTKSKSTICDLVFPSTILAAKLSNKRLIVVLEMQIYIYDISTMRLLHTIETSANGRGLCGFAGGVSWGVDLDSDLGNSANTSSTSLANSGLLAYPSPPKTITHDSLLVTGINTNGGNNSAQNNILSVSNTPNRVGDVIIFDTLSLQPLSVIEAHKSTLSALCLSNNGSLLATASDKGTIVRIFNVMTGVKLYQFRRGTYPTKIFSLRFSNDNKYVVATSSSGTVHIFRLGEEEALENKHKRRKTRVQPIAEEEEEEEVEEGEENHQKQHQKRQKDKKLHEEDDNDDIIADDLIRDDGDDSDAEDIEEEDEEEEEEDDSTSNISTESPDNRRKNSQGSEFTTIDHEDIPSSNNGTKPPGSPESATKKSEPLIDHTRLSVARIIRRSSQTLGRKAAQKMGDFLPSRFSSILEPTRHFASIKISRVGKDVKSLASISSELQDDLVPQQYLHSEESNEGIDQSEMLNLKLMHINVVTSEGVCYTYGLDPERGGDCILLHQYSMI